MTTKQTVNLDGFSLGPPFITQTPASFVSYVESLKLEKNLGRIQKPPRIAKPKLLHDANELTMICDRCKKRVRVLKGKCPGVPTEKPLTFETESVKPQIA